MPQFVNQHVECPIIVLAITETQLQGDAISDTLRADLLGAVERSGAKSVVLDFHHVTYLSSVAFRPLLSLHRKLKERGGRLVLCGMNERISEVFHVTRLVSTAGTTAAPFVLESDVPAAITRLCRTA